MFSDNEFDVYLEFMLKKWEARMFRRQGKTSTTLAIIAYYLDVVNRVHQSLSIYYVDTSDWAGGFVL